MSNMRDMYAVSFIELIDSTYEPRIEMKKIRADVLGPKNYIRIKASSNTMEPLQPIDIKKFKNKNEFIGHIVQSASDVWNKYENTKKFENECQGIIDDINHGTEIEKDADNLDKNSYAAAEKNLSEVISKRPDPVNNNGIFRRVDIKR